jgi:putrescine transport system ATP-binding protein
MTGGYVRVDMQSGGSSATTAEPLLSVRSVVKRFGGFTAVDHLSLDVKAGEFFALLGPSGCGKSTLLRMLAGFENPDDGQILLAGADIAGVPPHLRPVNMMFQNYALFPHLSVHDNVAFGLKRAGLPREDIASRTAEMLELVRLGDFAARRPDQLSGGQRQRVALARALARRPRLLLLDEPLAALDRKLRERTQFELADLQRRLGLTFIVVTHDQEEAMTLAHRIGVMDKGKLVQVDTPRRLYERPNSRFVADFVGNINLLEATLERREGDLATLHAVAAGAVTASMPMASTAGSKLWIAIRPEQILMAPSAQADLSQANHFAGTLVSASFLGGLSINSVKLDDGAIIRASKPNEQAGGAGDLSVGDRVTISFPSSACLILDN